MAEMQQISLHKARIEVMQGEILVCPLSDKPRPSSKRLFYDRSATSQAHRHHGPDLTNPNGLTPSYYTNSRVSSTPLMVGDQRRYSDEENDEGFHVEKRSRTSDWPLRSTTTNNEAHSISRITFRDPCNILDSASPPCYSSVKPRPSKFVEGSMNDRASQKPHPSYIIDSEQSKGQLETELGSYSDIHTKTQFDGLVHHKNLSVVLTADNGKSELSRPSTLFRFGKSVAAAFNPSSWKIWSKQQEEDTQEKTILRERHDKAEKIYKELKRTGQFRGLTCETQLDAQNNSILFNKHDSGVNLEHSSNGIDTTQQIRSGTAETRIEEKRHGLIFLDSQGTGSFVLDQSQASKSSAPLRGSSSLNPGSALKTVETLSSPQALRRLPSRKDLQKQQKLVKRVSDLEGKLEAARRQLAEALGEPLPDLTSHISRPRFTPGVLASLPSESLLGAYSAPQYHRGDADTTAETSGAIAMGNWSASLVSNDEDGKPGASGPITTTSERSSTLAFVNTAVGSSTEEERDDNKMFDAQVAGEWQVEQVIGGAHQENSACVAPKRFFLKKRNSFGIGSDVTDAGVRPKHSLEIEDGDSSEVSRAKVPKRGPGRPRKLQKVDPEPKPLQVESADARNATSRAMVEPNILHGRTFKPSNDHRGVLSKKVASSTRHTRLPRESRYSSTPPPPRAFSTTYTVNEVSTGKNAEGDAEGVGVISIVPSTVAGVPPTPILRGTGDLQQVAPAVNGMTGCSPEISTQDKTDLGRRRLQATVTDVKHSKHAFEWPADVF